MKIPALIISFIAIFSHSFSQTGKTVWTKGGHTSAVDFLHFDGAGTLVSSGGPVSAPFYSYGGFTNDPSIYAWDVATGNIVESYYSGTRPYFFQNTAIEWNSQEVRAMVATNTLVAGAYELKTFKTFSTDFSEYFVGTNFFVFDRTTGAQRDSVLLKQDSNVAFALHPFKDEIAFCSGATEITIRDIFTKQTIRTITQPGALAMEYSPDGKTVAIATRGSGVTLWRLKTGEKYYSYSHNKPIKLLKYFKENGYLLAVDTTGEVLFCNTVLGSFTKEPSGHQAAVTGIATSGSQYAFSSLDSTISVWNLDDATIRNEIRFNNGVTAVAFKNDGETLAAGLENGDIDIANSSGEDLRTLGSFKGRAEDVRFFSGDSAILVKYRNTSDIIGTFKAFDALNGDTIPHILSSGEYRYKVVSPDFRKIAFSRNDSVFLTDISNASQLLFLTTLKSGISGSANVWLTFSPDSRIVSTSGFGDTTTNFWSAGTGEILGRIPKRFGILSQPRYSLDASLILAEDTIRVEDRPLTTVWNSEDFTLLKRIPIVYHESATISPDNSKVAVIGNYDKWRVRIWDLETMQMSAESSLDSSRYTIGSYLPNETKIAFTTDSKYLAIVNKKIYLWDVANKIIEFVIHDPKAPEEFSYIDFSNDGRYLVSAGKSVRLWDLNGITSVKNETPVFKNTSFLKVFPNPSSGILTLQLDPFKNISGGEIRIYNSLGILLKTVPAEFLKEMNLDCSELSSGVYFVELSSENRVVSRTSFVIAQ